ncbi:hypothetical protein SLEP1_g52107 [Rubroshorea leprosula]|uniref:Leucine-rich repeat-containing N-terminal plant-type domain-containing protein n=1 Tax=Rubroshorea leprosula TaxID=152421 RepID=A0AAV5M6A9_9ROSI|nr:hypothetical protein SLEP1_g52107 [Rubroshorea leprosula]
MGIFTVLCTPLCLLFFFLCLKAAFSSSIHASSLSAAHLCSHEEALALLQFKASFSINFIASNPDLCEHYYTKPYSKTESWKEGIDCCSWDGVSCENVIGHVIALDLSCSLLFGTFPSNSTLFLLKNLQSLNLAFNDFRLSKIPPEISQFTRLKHLDVSSSRFLGQVPAEIAHLPKLVSLNLSNHYDSSHLILETTTFKNLVHNLSEVRELDLRGVNMTSVNPRFFMNLSSSLTTLDLFNSGLRGNFPNSIFHFPNLKNFYLSGEPNLTIDLPSSNWSSPLQRLYLGDMDCGRRLPESIGDLKSLQYLCLICNLEVSIPASIGKLRQLTSLYLCLNNLSGEIPSSLANLTQLSDLDLSNNQFSGPIPTSIGNLRQLTRLALYSNDLSGEIPSSLANLTQLSDLDLSHNQFSGLIPASIGNLRQLTRLALYSNNLSGEIPSSLTNLSQLTFLHLSNNQFFGPIPASIGNLQQLTGLALYSNNLSGQITPSLANLTQLSDLDLSHNQFSGPIPFHAIRFSKLMHLDLSYNLLNGTLPPWIFTLPLLEYFYLNHNQFQGQISQFQQNSLTHIDLVICVGAILSSFELQASDFRTTLRNEPFLQLFHSLYVYPLTVSLSWKRNLFVRVELRKDDADVRRQPSEAMYPREPGLSLQKWAHMQVAEELFLLPYLLGSFQLSEPFLQKSNGWMNHCWINLLITLKG